VPRVWRVVLVAADPFVGTRRQVSSPPAETPALRDYEISGLLASGATGTFYAGRHRLTGHPVALQRIAPRLTEAAGFVDRLGNAARKVATLRNPHVVGVYDLVVEDGVYLVLELVGGPSLRKLAPPTQPLPPAAAIAAVDDVLNALESAHAEGVVHGDIRAEHVLATPQGTAKLGGFAISQALLLLPNHPGAKRAGYSSPERLAGMPPDARSDLYAVAAMASELMTGVAPSPGRIGPPALPAVSDVLRRGLSSDATRRFSTATELRSALVGAVAGSLGPAWRLASDLGDRATAAVGGEALPLPPPPASSSRTAPPSPIGVPGFGVPPPPGASVMQGAIPPPPVARPPASPPPSYLPPPQPRERAAITEIDGDEHRRAWLAPLLTVLGLLAVAGAVLGVLFGTGVLGGGGSASSGPLQLGNDVALAVSPQGSCSSNPPRMDFHFVATGSVSGVGTLSFRWERSDGQQTDDIPVTVTSNEGSFRFTTTWSVQGHQVLNGTMTFHVLSPTPRVVHQAITYNCP
jgi:serine/threonine protein kinase